MKQRALVRRLTLCLNEKISSSLFSSSPSPSSLSLSSTSCKQPARIELKSSDTLETTNRAATQMTNQAEARHHALLSFVVALNLIMLSVAQVDCTKGNNDKVFALTTGSSIQAPTLNSGRSVQAEDVIFNERNEKYQPKRAFFRYHPRPSRFHSPTLKAPVTLPPSSSLSLSRPSNGQKTNSSAAASSVGDRSQQPASAGTVQTNTNATTTTALDEQTNATLADFETKTDELLATISSLANNGTQPSNVQEAAEKSVIKLVEGFLETLLAGMCENNCTASGAGANQTDKIQPPSPSLPEPAGSSLPQASTFIASILSKRPPARQLADISGLILDEIKGDDSRERLSKRTEAPLEPATSSEQPPLEQLDEKFEYKIKTPVARPDHEKRDERAAVEQSANNQANLRLKKKNVFMGKSELRKSLITSVFGSKFFTRDLSNGRNITREQFSQILSSLSITSPRSPSTAALGTWFRSEGLQRLMGFMHFG